MSISEQRRWALILILLVACNEVSTQVLLNNTIRRAAAVRYDPFRLKDGSDYTPPSFEALEHSINEIDFILSVGFLLWLDVHGPDIAPRYDILELTSIIPTTGNSSELVNKLMRHHQADREIREVETTQDKLRSGDFVLDMMFDAGSTDGISLCKSVLIETLRTFGSSKQWAGEGRVAKECDVPDMYDGVVLGNENILLQVAQLLFTGECTSVGDFGRPGKDLANALQLPDIPNFDFYKTLAKIAWAMKTFFAKNKIPSIGSGAISIIISLASIAYDIYALIKGNLTGLQVAMHVLSIINNVISIILVIAMMLVSTVIGAVIAVVAAILKIIFALLDFILGRINRERLAKQFVKMLDQIVPLTEEQKRRIKEDHKKGKELSEQDMQLVGQTLYNFEVVKLNLETLSEPDMKDFRTIVVPAYNYNPTGKYGFVYVNNRADLRGDMTIVRLAQWAPRIALSHPGSSSSRSKARSVVTCAPEGTANLYMRAYPCTDTIGITNWESEGNMTLVVLGNGTDTAYGTTNFKNVFVIEKGNKEFLGGNENDVFSVRTHDLRGTLNGGLGQNVIELNADNITDSVVVKVDLLGHRLHLNTAQTRLENMPVVLGRESSGERITIGCDTSFIDGRGGRPGVPDIIEGLASASCEFDVFVELGPYTKIENDAPHGQFVYNITHANFEQAAELRIGPTTRNSSHFINLEPDLSAILNVTYVNRIMEVTSVNRNRVLTSSTVLLNETDQFQEPALVLPDQIVIRVDSEGVVNTIFNLTEYAEFVRAPRFGQATFLLSTTFGQIVGDAGNDTVFLLPGASCTRLDGRGGTNKLIIDPEFSDGLVVYVDLVDRVMRVGENGEDILLQGFQQVIGRQNATDHVLVGCDETFVDCQGGQQIEPDRILIARKECDGLRTAFTRLSANTVVTNQAQEGQFIYFVPFAPNVELGYEFRTNLTHIVQFEFDQKEITNASVNNGTGKLEISNGNATETLRFALTEDIDTGPVFITKDGVIIRASLSSPISFVYNVTSLEAEVGATVWPIRGWSCAENVFLIERDPLSIAGGDIIGGDLGDTFLVAGDLDPWNGKLFGGPGEDRLVLSSRGADGEPLAFTEIVNMSLFQSIEGIVGRNDSSEHILVNCRTLLVDGGTGSGTVSDFIEVTDNRDEGEACLYDTLIVVRPHTTISNAADANGTFRYLLRDMDEGLFDLELDVPTGNHTVLLPWSQHQIVNVTYSNVTSQIQVRSFNASINIKAYTSPNTGEVKPDFILADTVQLAVKNASESNHFTATFVLNASSVENGEPLQQRGFLNLQNVFMLVSGGEYTVEGGHLDDTFVVANGSALAILNGGHGENTVVLSPDVKGQVEIRPKSAYSESPKVPALILFQGMSHILGSNASAESITIDCSVQLVDGGGGVDEDDLDMVTVPDLPCNYSATVFVNGHTLVTTLARHGDLFYMLKDSISSGFTLYCEDHCGYESSKNITHTFAVDDSSEIVANITTNQHDCSIHLLTTSQRDLTFRIERLDEDVDALWSGREGEEDPSINKTCVYPRLAFTDGFLFDTSYVGLTHGQYKANATEDIDSLMSYYTARAIRLNVSITVLSADETEILQIGREDFDSLLSSPDHTSHLYGNGGLNMYTIGMDDKPIADVHIYCEFEPGPGENHTSIEIIDMTQLVRPLRTRQNDFYLPRITTQSDGTIRLTVEDEQNRKAIGSVILHRWEQLLDGGGIFVFGEAYMQLNVSDLDDDLFFDPIPIEYTNETTIVMDPEELEPGTKIHMAKQVLPVDNSVLRKGDDLVLTNVFAMDDDRRNEDASTFFLFFKDFLIDPVHRERNLPSGVSITFSDGTEVLLDTVEDVYDLEDMDDVRDRIADAVEEEVFAFQCYYEGYFTDPKDCTSYYRCVSIGSLLKPIHLACPAGTLFCTENHQCDTASSDCTCTQVR